MRSAIGLKKKYPGEVVLSGDRFAVDFAADMADNESAVSGVFLVTDKKEIMLLVLLQTEM